MTVLLIIYSFSIPIDWNLRVIISDLWGSFGSFGFILLSTYWVIRQYNNELLRNDALRNGESKKMSLEDILATKDGFDLFANHLVNEFSIENLTFVFQVMQMKYEAMKSRSDVFLF